jgi:hypothetical protein
MGKTKMTENNFETVNVGGEELVRVPPNASRMIHGMSRLSYAFEEAIADLIDNSIAASSSKVEVLIEQRIGGKVYVHVLDNGTGIAKHLLPSAIQYGADDRKDAHSLGVYGFGLKTACQSFTANFAVVSRVLEDSHASMITFDEALIDQYNDYLFRTGNASPKFERTLRDFVGEGSGTLIVADNADRFFTSDSGMEDERKTQRLMKKKVESTQDHLRKVFQRFLDVSDTRASNVEISVNGVQLTPWDPFCLKEPLVQVEAERHFENLRTKTGRQGNVVVRGYILPPKEEFEDNELWSDAQVGPNTHGVYVYRENRCIVQATYFELFKRETHLSNLRVEFSYDGTLDELFHTALQKGSMNLGDLEEAVHEFLKPLVRETNLRSRGSLRKKDTRDLHQPSQKLIGAVEGRIAHAQIERVDGKSASVQSKYGPVILPIPSLVDDAEVLPINPVDSIDDGLLWQIRLHNGRQVVELNKGHDFYNKIYLPNKGNTVAIRGLDMVFWSLAITEANCTIPEYQRQFREFRYEVSRALRELVESLPEPKLDDDDN